MSSEFDLIKRYFTTVPSHADLGVGDDAALFTSAPGVQCVVSADMMVEGTHFLPDTNPQFLGHKCLAVNLSDLAAMGSTPRYAFLSLALPDADEDWISAFARGFLDLAQRFDVDLAGGDTTRGPRAINVTVIGEVPKGAALLRSGANPGEDVWLSGTTGEAILGLWHAQGEVTLSDIDSARCRARLERPQPRVALGLALRGIATAAIDVSDGLLADLGHLCARSHLGAVLYESRLPWSSALTSQSLKTQRTLVFSGGDDYELCFTAAVRDRAKVIEAARRVNVEVTRIGSMVETGGVQVLDRDGQCIQFPEGGFDHFR